MAKEEETKKAKEEATEVETVNKNASIKQTAVLIKLVRNVVEDKKRKKFLKVLKAIKDVIILERIVAAVEEGDKEKVNLYLKVLEVIHNIQQQPGKGK